MNAIAVSFGDMHTAIVKSFKKYYMFGFTRTPIFPINSGSFKNGKFLTTEQTFGDKLHTYTIVNAINDKNVLPFRVDYFKTMDTERDIDDEQVRDIDRDKAFMAPQRISLVTKYILDHFDKKTYRGDKSYIFSQLTNISDVASAKRGAVEEIKQKQRISGFNSIFAVASVPMAKLYYVEFRKQMGTDPVHHCHRVISILINRALKKGNIKTNPLLGADIPSPGKEEAKSYSDKDIEAFRNALESEKDFQFKTAMHLLLSSGARLGEIMGLVWNQVDFTEGTIFIKQASQYLPKIGTFIKETPKNDSSIRFVGLPEAVMDMLSDLQHEQKVRKIELANVWINSGFVFVNPDGSQMYTYSYTKRLNKFLKKNELPPLPLHGLRHTAASYLIDAGESIISVAERLGHADGTMLMKRYGHKFRKGDKSSVDKMSKLYPKKEEETSKAN